MRHFFDPASVALVGASPNRTGGQLLGNLLLSENIKIYPVNPKYPELAGLPCYPSVKDIPGKVDLAVLLVPAKLAPAVLADCAVKGVDSVMIQSAGFSETGPEGRKLQEQCDQVARQAGMRLWGPNCMGLVDVKGSKFFTFMNTSITPALLPEGGLSLVVQSGMLSAGFLADLATRRMLPVSKACSLGNKCDVDECDVLEYLLEDQDTRAVALYLESLPRGRRFIEMARASRKPLVVLKSGHSHSGAKAALSHTASLAGNAALTDGLLKAAEVQTARDFHQMVEMGCALSRMNGLPDAPRCAVLTFSGGAGILSCDLLEEAGLELAELAEETLRGLKEIYPAWMEPANPVDLWPAMEIHGPAETLVRAVEITAQDPNVDLLFIHYFLGAQNADLDLDRIKKAAEDGGKRLAFWGLGLAEPARDFQLKALNKGMLVFGEMGRAVECLAAAARWQPKDSQPVIAEPVSRPVLTNPESRKGIWDEYQAKQLLAAWDIPVVQEVVAEDLPAALKAAEELGWPLALKGLPPGEVHKTEKGLVCLNLSDAESLQRQWRRIAPIVGAKGKMLLQRMHQPEYELIAGFLRDPQFGACVMVGMGGVLAELEPDVAFELAPLSMPRALAMLERLRAKKLFNGYRGYPVLDRSAVAKLICRLGDLGAALEEIEQIDINPVAVEKGNPLALDATIIWKSR
jgi:acyl-CoA synthetase (NDP forming)